MKLSKITAAIALSAAASFSGGAMSATINNLDGALTPFGGFDWASGGAAWTTGLAAAETAFFGGCAVAGSCNFTINYAGWAGNLNMPSGGSLSTPNLDSNPDGNKGTVNAYEYTMKAQLTGTILAFVPGVVAQYSIGGGSFSIFYDTSANANITGAGWTGFNNGVNIISGSLATPTPEVFNLLNGSGSINLVGAVTSQNGAFVNPAILGTTVTSTLQLFPSAQITNFTAPLSVDGTPVDFSVNEAVFQADANQNFTFKTPEPASMLLTGLALLGAGVVSRRRRQA